MTQWIGAAFVLIALLAGLFEYTFYYGWAYIYAEVLVIALMFAVHYGSNGRGVMTDYVMAATSLVKLLKAPPQAHSVYIRSDVDRKSKEFKRTLCVSWHPDYNGNKKVPKEYMGYPVELVKWPKDL